jgi:hypothetical protein
MSLPAEAEDLPEKIILPTIMEKQSYGSKMTGLLLRHFFFFRPSCSYVYSLLLSDEFPYLGAYTL